MKDYIACNKSVYSYLKDNAERIGNCTAFFSKGKTYSWSEAFDINCALTKEFLDIGVREDKKIVVKATNSIDLAMILLALTSTGALVIMSDPYVSNDNGLPKTEAYVQADFYLINEDNVWKCISGGGVAVIQINKKAESITISAPLMCSSTKPAFMFFTAGSTGERKGVILSEYSIINNSYNQALQAGVTENDRYMLAAPMHHIFGICILFAGIACGAGLCFPDNVKAEGILDSLEKFRCTRLDGVPTLYLQIIEEQKKRKRDISPLSYGIIAGGSYSSEQFGYIEKQLGMRLCPSYGMTETAAALISVDIDGDFQSRSSSVGKFVPGVRGVLKANDGEVISMPDKIGEICVSGINLMLGYYNGELILPLDSDGYFHTGDLAYKDEKGNFHLIGRNKDIIIRGGENLSPARLESIIASVAGVDNVCVVGIPDEKYGEIVAAYVVSKTLDEKTLKIGLESKLSKVEMPTCFVISKEMPVISAGKPDKVLIKKILSGSKR